MFSDNFIYSFLIVFVAEIVFRFGQLIREWLYFYKNYDISNRRITMFRNAFNFTQSTIVFAVFVMSVFLYRLEISHILNFGKSHIYLIPLWWTLRLIKFSRNTISYSEWIRAHHGLDCATSMAASYFHGYLNLTMPTHDDQKGIKERMDNYESKNNVTFARKCLFIMIPNSLHFKAKIESEVMDRVTVSKKKRYIDCFMNSSKNLKCIVGLSNLLGFFFYEYKRAKSWFSL